MKRKANSIIYSFDASSSSLNEIGKNIYSEMKLSYALYHFQKALNTYSTQVNENVKKAKLTVDKYNFNSEIIPTNNYNLNVSTPYERKINFMASQYDQGFDKFLNVHSLSQNGCNNEISTILFNIGVLYNKMSEFDQALSFFYKSINSLHCNQTESNDLLISNLCNIGTSHYIKQEYEKALKFYSEALEFAKYENSKTSSILNCMGVLKLEMSEKYKNETLEIIRYFKKSLDIKISLKEASIDYLTDIATIFNNIGRLLSLTRHDKLKEAKQALRKALSIRKVIYGETSIKVAQVIKHLAHVYKLLGNTDKEEKMYYNFLSIAQSNSSHIDIEVANVLNSLGQMY